MPDISVCISYYKQPDDLRACLAAYRAQTDRDFEIVVTCDEAPFGWHDRHPWFRDLFPPGGDLTVKVVFRRSEDPSFVAGTWNRGARAASGERLIFTNADCVPDDNLVAIHAALRGSLATGPIWRTPIYEVNSARKDHPDDPEAQIAAIRKGAQPSASRDLASTYRYAMQAVSCRLCHVWGGLISIDRTDFDRIEGFDEGLHEWGGEDADLGIRAHLAGLPVLYSPQARMVHMDHDVRFQGERSGRNFEHLGAKYGHKRVHALLQTLPRINVTRRYSA